MLYSSSVSEHVQQTLRVILDFKNFKFLTVGTVKSLKLHRSAKFRQNRSNRARGMAVLGFFKMAAAATLLKF